MIKSHVIQLGGLSGKERGVIAARKLTFNTHCTVSSYQECFFYLQKLFSIGLSQT